MLQVDLCTYASDALEDAMRLAQTKSLNSFSFSDCLNFLNYVWADIYSQVCLIDSGYYSKTVKLNKVLTKLPKFVRNSVLVYSAQRPVGYNRVVFRQSGETDLTAANTYRISGTDLYCPDAVRTSVWLEYCPQPPQIFFTMYNRDPKVLVSNTDTIRNEIFGMYSLVGDLSVSVSDTKVTGDNIASVKSWRLVHRNKLAGIPDIDISSNVIIPEDSDGIWQLKYISCDFPYIFCSYQHNITGVWKSGFFTSDMEWTDYTPFEWTGRGSNVEYIQCKYNDKTGMGVVVRDWSDFTSTLVNTELPKSPGSVILVHNSIDIKDAAGTVHTYTQGYWYTRFSSDTNYAIVEQVEMLPEDTTAYTTVQFNGELYTYKDGAWSKVEAVTDIAIKKTVPKVKELGWTPDTKLVYPAPEVYRYLVARLAEKFAAINESNVMGVQSELVDARFAFQAFLKKDKSAWERIRNVNPASYGDWL